jgi:tetratricopeptide (TPR) repeat protein
MSGRLLSILLVFAALGAASAARAAAADPGAVAAAWRDLASGVNQGSAPAMLGAQEAFSALSEADPSSAALHRGVALAGWRATPLLLNQESTRPQARAALDAGLAHCDAALKLDAADAEALALKGSLQAFVLSLEPGSAMTLGPECGANLKRAVTLAPKDPRVHLLQAIFTLHAPAFFGGGADKALPGFARAIELFATDAPGDSTAPAWGRDDALLWAGQAEAKLGHTKEAGEYYQRALAANPSNGWVRQLMQQAPAKPAGEKP